MKTVKNQLIGILLLSTWLNLQASNPLETCNKLSCKNPLVWTLAATAACGAKAGWELHYMPVPGSVKPFEHWCTATIGCVTATLLLYGASKITERKA